MTHQDECPVIDDLTALLIEHGPVALRIPQTLGYRDESGRPFYPQSLERGVRSERAMTLAVPVDRGMRGVKLVVSHDVRGARVPHPHHGR